MGLGQRIKKVRNVRKLTQQELATKACISRSYLADVERERYNPSLSTLEALATALDVSLDRLTGESASSIIESKLEEIKMTQAELTLKAKLPLGFLSNLDTIAPDEGDYGYITKVAEILNIPGAKLRTALARQEAPVYEGPYSTAEEDFGIVAESTATYGTIAAHRTDDPTSELPEAARKSIEDFKKFIYEKHGIKYD